MNKRYTGLAAAVASLPLAALFAPAPATAAGRCDSPYPPGSTYRLRINPSFIVIHPGATVELSSRLVRGGEECNAEGIGYYTRGRGGTLFRLSRSDMGDNRGLSQERYTPRTDFRWFTDHVEGRTRVAQSIGGLVQVR